MRNQTRKQLSKFFEQFPALTQIRAMFKWENNGLLHLPYTHIHVQKPDTEFMNQKGRHIRADGRAYVMGSKDKRGSKLQYLVAVGFDETILATMWWSSYVPETMGGIVQDIFSHVDSEKVNYLVWASFYMWFHPTSEEEEMDDLYFGKVANAELEIIVYPKLKDKSWLTLAQEADTQKEELENAYKHDPKEQPPLPGIENALTSGALLHGFLSGGGLRVVDVKKDRSSIGYGEHPYFEIALNLLEDDIVNGPRDYYEVYGATQPHYLTGSTMPSSNLDHWIRQGHKIDCWTENDEIVCRLTGWTDYQIPTWVKEQQKVSEVSEISWDDRGIKFHMTVELAFFADGEDAYTLSVAEETSEADKLRAFMYEMQKVGRGKTLWEAMLNALKAPEEEIFPNMLEG